MNCPRCRREVEETMDRCPYCGSSFKGRYQGYPMKWYFFVLYVQLIANVILNVMTGASIFDGTVYGSPYVFEVYPMLRYFDYLMAILLFLICFYAVFVWRKLKGLCRNADFYLMVFRLGNLLWSIFFNLGVVLIAMDGDVSLLLKDAVLMGDLFSMGLMIVLEKVYFGRRSHLFQN